MTFVSPSTICCPFCLRNYGHIKGSPQQKALTAVATDSGFHYFCKSRTEIQELNLTSFPFEVNTYDSIDCFTRVQQVLKDYHWMQQLMKDKRRDMSDTNRILARMRRRLKVLGETDVNMYTFNTISTVLSYAFDDAVLKSCHKDLKRSMACLNKTLSHLDDYKYLRGFHKSVRYSKYTSSLDAYCEYRLMNYKPVHQKDLVQEESPNDESESTQAVAPSVLPCKSQYDVDSQLTSVTPTDTQGSMSWYEESCA